MRWIIYLPVKKKKKAGFFAVRRWSDKLWMVIVMDGDKLWRMTWFAHRPAGARKL